MYSFLTSFIELCQEGSQLLNWISHHQLYRLFFCNRRDNGGRGYPLKASIEWCLLEEQRIFLTRFYLNSNVNGGVGPRLYANMLRRSARVLFGRFLSKSPFFERILFLNFHFHLCIFRWSDCVLPSIPSQNCCSRYENSSHLVKEGAHWIDASCVSDRVTDCSNL